MEVGYVEHMGNDNSVVRAARVSFHKAPDSYSEEANNKLIRYLAEHKHVLPFRHPQITLHLKVPFFVVRQLDKHQVGFSTSEVSRRYIDAEPEFYIPEKWRKRAENKKQGSREDEFLDIGLEEDAPRCFKLLADLYNLYLYQGLCPEQARIFLPLSTYTEQIKTGSLLGWYNLYKLRTHPDAQVEVRAVAENIKEIIKPFFPVSWKALEDYT